MNLKVAKTRPDIKTQIGATILDGNSSVEIATSNSYNIGDTILLASKNILALGLDYRLDENCYRIISIKKNSNNQIITVNRKITYLGLDENLVICKYLDAIDFIKKNKDSIKGEKNSDILKECSYMEIKFQGVCAIGTEVKSEDLRIGVVGSAQNGNEYQKVYFNHNTELFREGDRIQWGSNNTMTLNSEEDKKNFNEPSHCKSYEGNLLVDKIKNFIFTSDSDAIRNAVIHIKNFLKNIDSFANFLKSVGTLYIQPKSLVNTYHKGLYSVSDYQQTESQKDTIFIVKTKLNIPSIIREYPLDPIIYIVLKIKPYLAGRWDYIGVLGRNIKYFGYGIGRGLSGLGSMITWRSNDKNRKAQLRKYAKLSKQQENAFTKLGDKDLIVQQLMNYADCIISRDKRAHFIKNGSGKHPFYTTSMVKLDGGSGYVNPYRAADLNKFRLCLSNKTLADETGELPCGLGTDILLHYLSACQQLKGQLSNKDKITAIEKLYSSASEALNGEGKKTNINKIKKLKRMKDGVDSTGKFQKLYDKLYGELINEDTLEASNILSTSCGLSVNNDSFAKTDFMNEVYEKKNYITLIDVIRAMKKTDSNWQDRYSVRGGKTLKVNNEIGDWYPMMIPIYTPGLIKNSIQNSTTTVTNNSQTGNKDCLESDQLCSYDTLLILDPDSRYLSFDFDVGFFEQILDPNADDRVKNTSSENVVKILEKYKRGEKLTEKEKKLE